MSVRNDTVQIRVEIDGQAGINELGQLEMATQNLRAGMKGLKKDSAEYAASATKLDEVKARMVELRDEIGLQGLSMRQLRQYQQDVKREWDGAIPGTEKFAALDADLKAVNSQILTLAGNLKKPATDFAALARQVGVASMSLDELTQYQKQLSAELAAARPDAANYEQLSTELRNVSSTMDDLKAAAKTVGPSMGLIAQQVGVAGMSVRELTQYQKELQEAWNNAQPNTAEYEELNQELNKVNSTLAQQKAALAEVPGAYAKVRGEVGLAGMTMNELTGLQKELTTEMNNTVASSDDFPQISQRLDDVTQHINDQNGVLGKWGQAWKDSKKELFSFGVQAAVAGAATAVVAGIGTMIEKNKELADSLSNIQKTTDMSAEEVGQLNTQLSKISTRTASKELRDIAAVAGQLGIAKDQVGAFVIATDKLNVSLGDEITGGAEEVTRVMGGLRNVLTDIKGEQVDQDMLHIGNALNVLAAQGAATAPVVADIANRIGGVGISMGLTSGQTLGLAATMQELNISAERGGTAVVKILQHMAAEPEKFAAAAKMGGAEFKKMVDSDIYGALKKVMQGASGSGAAATELAATLSSLGVDGAGASEVIAKMGQNIGMLDGKSATATKALTETSSIMGEFDKLNNNFAAKLERVQKGLAGVFTMSTLAKPLEGLITFLDKFLNKASEMDQVMAAFDRRSKEVADLTTNVSDLATRYDELAKKASLSAEEQTELQTVIEKITKAVPEAATEWDKYGNTIKVNTGIVGKWVQQQKEALKILNAKDIAEARTKIDEVRKTITAYTAQIQASRETMNRLESDDAKNAMKRIIASIQGSKKIQEAELSGYELILARMTGEKTKAQLAQEEMDRKAAANAAAKAKADKDAATAAMGYLEQIAARIKELREKQQKVSKSDAPQILAIEKQIEQQEQLRDRLLGKFKKDRDKKTAQARDNEHAQALAAFQKLQLEIHKAREKVNLDELDEDQRALQQVEQKYDELEHAAQGFTINISLTAQERHQALAEIERVAEARAVELEQLRDKQRLARNAKRWKEEADERQAQAALRVILASAALDEIAPEDDPNSPRHQKAAAALLSAQTSQIETLRNIKLRELENYRLAEHLNAQQVEQRRLEIIAQSESDIAALKNRSRDEQRRLDYQSAQQALQISTDLLTTFYAGVHQYNQRIRDQDARDDQKALTGEVKKLDEQRQRKMITEEEYNSGKERLEAKFADRDKSRKREAAQEQRQADILQATAQGFMAVLTGLAQGGPAMGVIAGILAAAQLGMLLATPLPEFRAGGYTQAEALALPHQNLSRSNGGQLPGGPFLATVNEAGPEYFVPNRLLNDPGVMQHVAAIEAVRTGAGRSAGLARGFVEGGATSNGGHQLVATSAGTLSETTGQAILAEMRQLNVSWSHGQVVRAEVVPEALARSTEQLASVRAQASF